MVKIGRNDTCPCGSGKKFKKCCIDILIPIQSERNREWCPKELEDLTTEEIINRLKYFGIPFTKNQFLKDIKKFHSGADLVCYWEKKYTINSKTISNMDFIWLACVTLWNRLEPDILNTEKLDDMMQQGYDLLRKKGKNHQKNAGDLWLAVWKHLKTRFTDEIKSIEDSETVFHGTQSIHNWTQDMEIALHNIGLDYPEYFQKRIDFCLDIFKLLPNTDASTMWSFRRVEAETHFILGNYEKGDLLFNDIIQNNPECVWGYIRWGDMYLWPTDKKRKDLKRAEGLYKMALNKDLEDEDCVLERLKYLEEKKNEIQEEEIVCQH